MEKYLSELCSVGISYADSNRNGFPKSKMGRNIVRGESIVFKKHLNNASIVYSEDFYEVNTDLVVVSNANTQEVLLKYIYYYLCANRKDWRRYYVGTTLLNLSPEDMKYVRIFYPSLNVQQHIIAIFDLLYDIKNNRMKSNYTLMTFLSSYYQYLEKATGRFWTSEVKLGNILKGYERNSKSNEGVWMFPLLPSKNGFQMRHDSYYSFTVDKKACNPYFLCVALYATGKFIDLVSKIPYKMNQISAFVSEFSEISLNLPNKDVQKEFEKRYLQIEKINGMMGQFSNKINLLLELLFSRLLSKNSKHPIWEKTGVLKTSLWAEIDKCTYDDYNKIASILEYDERRMKIYDGLEKKVIEQFFDVQDGKIKFRKVAT